MDFSKKTLFQSLLAFLLGCAVCGLLVGLVFHNLPVKTPQINTRAVSIVAGSHPQPPSASMQLRPIQHRPMQTVPIRLLVKQTDYDKPGYFSSWVASDAPDKAVLLCVHGIGLHSEAFADLGKRLSQRGYPTYSMDVRGFGRYMKSDETLDFPGTLRDVGQIVKVIQIAHPKVPIVLVGESMGGAIAIQAGALYQHDIAGIIASAPGDLRFHAGKMDVKVGLKLMTHPNKRVDWGDQILSMATSNPKLQEKWRTDPLVRLKMAPRELLKFQSFMSKTETAAGTIQSVPMLFLHGGDDELMRVKGTIELFNNIPSTRKDLFILGQREHMLLEEGQFDDKTIRLVQTWLDSSLKVAEKHALVSAY